MGTTGAPLNRRRKENDILALSGPIFVELLLQLLVGNVDQIMVGWHDPNGVGAIGNANQVTSLLLLVFSVVSTASMILVSQYIGARDTKRVGETYAASLAMNFVFGIAVSLVLIAGCGPILRLMGVHEEIFHKACVYMQIVGAGMVFQSLYLTFTAFFRSSQLMRDTMAVSVVMNGINILGNALLIGGPFGLPAFGVAGAALSSTISRLIGLLIIGALFAKKFGFAQVRSSFLPFPWMQLKKLLRIGLPAGGESVSYNLSQVCIQTICNRFAAFVVNTRVYATMFANVTYLCACAMAQACQVVAARLMGAGDTEGTERSVRRTLALSAAASGAVSILLYLFCEPVYGLFTKDPQVIALAKTIMLLEIPLELGRAVNMTMCRVLQACGDIQFPITLCVIFAWLFGVGGGYVLSVACGWGLSGLWAAMAADEVTRAALFLWRWKKGVWKEKCLLGGERSEQEA